MKDDSRLTAAETAVVLYLFIVSGKCLGIINIRYSSGWAYTTAVSIAPAI